MNIFKFVFALYLIFLQLPVSAGQLDLEPVFEKSRLLKLAGDPAWLNLLHYKQQVFSGPSSQADDARFFISVNGNTDPEAELQASLESIFNPADRLSFLCRFPARYAWLKSQLDFSGDLPEQVCDKFNAWKTKLNARQVTLLFPSMYLNNPASMFGHTFLRLDNPDRSPLLSYTLGYAAATDKDDGPLTYVYKGLSGGYQGVFNIIPYYATLQKYSDIEQRDIWEYPLNLRAQEVDQLLRHLWEVRGIQFDYYFIRENCSYRLLSLLDVARPGMNMTRQSHPVYAIPVDTVRTVEAAGLIDTKHYRPSRNNRAQQMYRQLDDQLQSTALQLSGNPLLNITELDSVQQARTLELAQEIVQLKKPLEEEKLHALFVARSKVKIPEQQNPDFHFESTSPEQGHPSARWHLGYGEKDRQAYVELGLRPMFHDLLDASAGFVEGASISVLDTKLRWYEEQQQLKLEQLVLARLVSLSPVTPWHTPVSGQLDVSIKRRNLNLARDAKIFKLGASAGLSTRWHEMMFYLFADSSIEYSKKLDDHYSLFLGGETGALVSFDRGTVKVMFASAQSVAGQDDEKQKVQCAYQLDLSRHQALRLEYSRVKYQFTDEKVLGLNYLRYF